MQFVITCRAFLVPGSAITRRLNSEALQHDASCEEKHFIKLTHLTFFLLIESSYEITSTPFEAAWFFSHLVFYSHRQKCTMLNAWYNDYNVVLSNDRGHAQSTTVESSRSNSSICRLIVGKGNLDYIENLREIRSVEFAMLRQVPRLQGLLSLMLCSACCISLK